MKRLFLLLVLLIPTLSAKAVDVKELYERGDIQSLFSIEHFISLVERFNEINPQKKILTYIDFTKSSKEKRLYVIDMTKGEILYNSYVSHGRKSGEEYATHFSNAVGSNMSSLGYYLTADSYYGQNGYSLRLRGLDKGLNDNAYKRAIVIHGASYANPSIIEKIGRLGRSLGCPALPHAESRRIIDTIKNGSVIYIHGGDLKNCS